MGTGGSQSLELLHLDTFRIKQDHLPSQSPKASFWGDPTNRQVEELVASLLSTWMSRRCEEILTTKRVGKIWKEENEEEAGYHPNSLKRIKSW